MKTLCVARRSAPQVIVSIGLLAMFVGCRSPDSNSAFGQFQWGDYEDAKSWLANYKHVILVCVCEDYWEDQGQDRNSFQTFGYSFHHFNGTVVNSYKGDWSTSDRVIFVHGLDGPSYGTTNKFSGKLLFLFTNEHTETEFGVDTGEFLPWDAETARQLDFVFSKKRL